MNIFILLMVIAISRHASTTKPHIIFILADDLGWNDVGFHGSGQIPTPNIDALAYSGLILNNYYVTPLSTPTRSALMTGKYPNRMGMQHGDLHGTQVGALPLTELLLPQYLKNRGYTTRIVGKWHLGSSKKEHTPTFRGFDSHLGFWTSHQDYFDHTAVEDSLWGLDMRRNLDVAYDLHGQYSTDIFTEESVKIIKSHNTSVPLFLYLAHLAVHSGNPYNPLPAPDEIVEKFAYIKDYKRQRFAAMLSKLDDSVGTVFAALKERDMLKNAIIVFSTDNGGPAAGFDMNAASNFPLRGVKGSLWEGALRGVGVLWSPLLKKRHRVADQLMHICDWLPTLYVAAGGSLRDFGYLNGIDMWWFLSQDRKSQREEIFHYFDGDSNSAAMRWRSFKYMDEPLSEKIWNDWFGPHGREYDYNVSQIIHSAVGLALEDISQPLTPDIIMDLRSNATINCSQSHKKDIDDPFCRPCLFNIVEDPCETKNLAEENFEIVASLQLRLTRYFSGMIKPRNWKLDPKGNPIFWNHVFSHFEDYRKPVKVPRV